jgi:hypothetical protein
MKGAHPDLSSTAWQETGVKPYFGLSGIPQHSTSLFLSLSLPRLARLARPAVEPAVERAVGAQPRDIRERPPCVDIRQFARVNCELPVQEQVSHPGCEKLGLFMRDA